MPVNMSGSPSVKVSPMLIVPWLWRPMMSPAQRLVRLLAVRGHEGERIRDAHLLAEPDVMETHARR
jgi:hypothetical protein